METSIPKIRDRSAIISLIRQTLLLILQARATLDDAGGLAGDLAATALTVDQKLAATTQDILETQDTARGVITAANDGLVTINQVTGAIGDVAASVAGITKQTRAGDAEALILGLLGTVSSDINAIGDDTRQALTESRAVLDQSGQLLIQGESVQTSLTASQTELAAMQSTMTDHQARIGEIELALQGDTLTQPGVDALLTEAQTLIAGIQQVTATVHKLEREMATLTTILDGMASAQTTLDETAHVAAELTPDTLDTTTVTTKLNTIQDIKVSQVKALERALDGDLPSDLVTLDTLVHLATGVLGVGEMKAITKAISGGLPLEIQQQTLEALGDTKLTAESVKALTAAINGGAFAGQEATLLASLVSGELTNGELAPTGGPSRYFIVS